MRIAQVAPLFESVPPKAYGGTERVVSWLTEELVRQGHDVTLFASGDSVTSARLYSVCEKSVRLNPDCVDSLALSILLLEEVVQQRHDFDIVHFHIDYLHFPVSRQAGIPHVTTLHGRLDIPELFPLYRRFNDMPVISISNSQRRPLPHANWVGTVYHGCDPERYTFHPTPGNYLAFLGRISPEKRVDRAIEIARRSGIPLKIAAKVDRADKEYFEAEIKPLLHDPMVEYIGEIGDLEKSEFLGNALALLFPIDWPEPFGLAMIEALACGTPVVAFNNGSVPEVIEDGVSGFVVDNMDDAVEAVERIETLSRMRCRHEFERRFSAQRMAADYVEIYQRMIDSIEVPATLTVEKDRMIAVG